MEKYLLDPKAPEAFSSDVMHEVVINTLSPHCFAFNDGCTDFVYISDKLKEFYPGTYKRLIKLFDKMEIEWQK